MLAPMTHILPLATIVRTRMLPNNGRILAHVGQKVNPNDVIAEALVGRKYVLVDAAKKLGIAQRKVSAFIQVKKGQQVAKDELLAQTTGLFAREVRAPAAGLVVAVGGGKIAIETGGRNFELVAGLPGVVTQVVGERGVVIRSSGAVVQGLWGNGRIETGNMFSVIESPEDVMSASRIDVSLRGSILLCGHVNDVNIFRNAAELPVRGLILSSIAPSLLSTAAQAEFPVIITDGFGRRTMNSTAYKLLSTNIKREITLNAEPFDRQSGSRPEIFIPLPFSQEPPEPRDLETFAPGQTVRVVYLARPSQTGTILHLRPGTAVLPNGIKTSAADIRLDNGQQVLVPLTNLEVLG